MKQIPFLAVCGAAAVALTACGVRGNAPEPAGSSEPASASLVGQGETMAEALCSTCHAVGREGDSPHADAVPFRQLSWMYPIETLAEPLAEGIIVGHPDMPEWQFEPKDVDALLAYIESIQEPQET